MPTEFEEVVCRTDAVQAEHLGQDARQQFLGIGGRSDESVLSAGLDPLRFGEGGAVEFAVRRQRHLSQLHEHRR
ncbi:hypothetical protein, partial [Streptomyces sp. SD11]|uniref:hypothetical protein n=1 Tax=Streptomyces sp. SD11 TaxID=3452209 RepID=UPI003F89883E